MSTDDALTMALFAAEQDGRLATEASVIEVPWTLDRAMATFLNRWCHRALGDRADAERELRELIDLASQRDGEAR